MNSRWVVSLLVLLSAGTLSSRAQPEKKSPGTNAALERFAQLAGDWYGEGMHDGAAHKMHVRYKVTAGGSAVVETIAPGTDHEMVTVIHADGDGLLLTHYCMLGNQPQMKAMPNQRANTVHFDFVRATNMKSEKDLHMHNVTFTFVDRDTLKSEWTNYQDGKAVGKAVFELKRKK